MTTVVVGVAAPDVEAAGAPAGQAADSVRAAQVPAGKAPAARAENAAGPKVVLVGERPVGETPVVEADRDVARAETPWAAAGTVTDGPVHDAMSRRVASEAAARGAMSPRVASDPAALDEKAPMTAVEVRAATGPAMAVGVRRGKRAPATDRLIRRSTLR